jgi:hypothetical protein
MLPFGPHALRPLLAPASFPWSQSLRRLVPRGHDVARWCERRPLSRWQLAALAGGVAAIVLLRFLLGGSARSAGEREVDWLIRPAATGGTTGFETNVGQAAAGVRFLAHGQGLKVFVLRREVRVAAENAHRPSVGFRLDEVDGRTRLRGEEPLPEAPGYRMSPLDEAMVTVASYGAVAYQDLYPGVDLQLSVDRGDLRLRFRVDRGASAAPIRVSLENAHAARDPRGLSFGASGLRIDDTAVHAYQGDETHRQAVPVALVLSGDRSLSLDLGPHDVRRPVDIVVAVKAAAVIEPPVALALAQ